MSFFKKFIVDDGSPEEDASSTPSPKQQKVPVAPTPKYGQGTSAYPDSPPAQSVSSSVFSPTPKVTGNPAVSPSFGIVGSIDQDVIDYLVKALEAANLPGVDYYEFKKALDANKNITGIPEMTLYQMTFGAMVATQSDVTPAKLLDTGNTYLGVIQKELDDYNASVEDKKAKEITTREKQIADLDADTDAKNKQIMDLTKNIQDNSAQKAILNDEITKSSTNIIQKQKNFEISSRTIIDQIGDNLDKIKKYLTPNSTT
jgi:hypothetical protein